MEQVATKAVGDYEGNLGGEGSIVKTGVHAGIACLATNAKDGDCASGALGGAVAEQMAGWLGSNGKGKVFDETALKYATLATSILAGAKDANVKKY